MGYYHIRLSKKKIKLCTSILLWGKYRYKCLPKGIANSPEISQQKMNDLFNGFEFISAYIDNLLILTQGDWTDHAHNPKLTLNRLKEKWLKYNIEISFLGKT